MSAVWSHSDLNLHSMSTKKKAAKGTVVVETIRDRLRLRWSYQGQRYYLYMELPDTITNQKVAEAKARLIESHMAAGVFDRTLDRYRPEGSKQLSLSVVELFQKFIDYKTKNLHPQSLAKYQGLLGHLGLFFKTKLVAQVGETEAEKFRSWLGKRVEPITLRERISLLNACWNWAVKRKWVHSNPWQEIKVKVPRQQKPKPFSDAEIKRIVEGFYADRYYSHYANYVEFLLGTGCRLGEAIALKWRHLNDDCSVVHFIESYYRGQFKGLKKEDERFVSLTEHLKKMLLARRPAKYDPNELVFPSARGAPIDDHNFRNRAWKTVLADVGVEYRKPRTTRATLVSHALDRGMSPAEVSELTGHTQETLFRHYAGNVRNRPQLPDLLGDS
jgi:integrase